MRMRFDGGAHHLLQWLAVVAGTERDDILRCCTDPDFDPMPVLARPQYDGKEKAHVLMLRGMLCDRLLEHCLHKRHWVSYGIADRCATLCHSQSMHCSPVSPHTCTACVYL